VGRVTYPRSPFPESYNATFRTQKGPEAIPTSGPFSCRSLVARNQAALNAATISSIVCTELAIIQKFSRAAS
jgi:hypothetical protein